MKVVYTEADLKEISNNQLSAKYYDRSLVALNGLLNMFGNDWIESELVVQHISDDYTIRLLGKNKIYSGITSLEKLVFLWEDIELLKGLPGYDELNEKLNTSMRFDNVDLEISIMSDIIRCHGTIELEPSVGNGFCDCRIKTQNSENWIYAEISRRDNSKAKTGIEVKGNELSDLVSQINPERHCVVVILKDVDENDYAKIVDWLKSKPQEGSLEDLAVFFTAPHSTDVTPKAFEYITVPITVRQSGDVLKGTFGSVYFHIADKGTKSKLNEKRKQLPQDETGLLFIDLTSVAGGFTDWEEQMEFKNPVKHFSAIILLSDGVHSTGFRREMKIIENPKSSNPLPDFAKEMLDCLYSARLDKSLMD